MGDGDDDRESSAPPSPGRNDLEHDRPISRPNNTQSASQSGSIGSPRSPSPGLRYVGGGGCMRNWDSGALLINVCLSSLFSRNSGNSPRHSHNGSPIEVGGPIALTASSKSGSAGGVAGTIPTTNSFSSHLFNSFGHHERWVSLIFLAAVVCWIVSWWFYKRDGVP